MGMVRNYTGSGTGRCGVGSGVLLSLALAAGMTALSLAAPQGMGGLRPLFAEDASPFDADATEASGDFVVPNGGNVQTTSDSARTGSGPVRMARFHIIEGKVGWRATSDAEWSSGAINLPLSQGAQVWTDERSRAEIEFDDGSRLRLDSSTLLTLQTLYSDSKGEFTEITVKDGAVFLSLRTQYSVYQVDTPLGSVKAAGPAQFRAGVGQGLQVAVRQGVVTVEGSKQQVEMHDGDYLDLRSADSPYTLTRLPNEDSFDSWNDARDRAVDALPDQPGYQNLPSNVAICADDLSDYGTWRDDSVFGSVWVPREDSGWRPYSDGRWVTCEPYGWTWVSAEPWGWAPYHYGTWAHLSSGWGWCPGPVNQYWSPACVSFYQSGGDIGWCPLAPWEVAYPGSLNCGFGYGDWSSCFSIGGCGVYYPQPGGVFGCRPWDSGWLNHGYFGGSHGNFGQGNFGGFENHNGLLAAGGFVPGNARWGASFASAGTFAGLGGSYHALNRDESARFFDHGSVVGAPQNGRPFAGPQSVHATAASGTIHGAFDAHGAPESVMNRSVFRPTSPGNVRAGETPGAQHSGSRTESGGSTGFTSENRQSTISGGLNGRAGSNRMALGTSGSGGGNRPHGLESYLSERSDGYWSTRSGSAGGFDSERSAGGFSHGGGDSLSGGRDGGSGWTGAGLSGGRGGFGGDGGFGSGSGFSGSHFSGGGGGGYSGSHFSGGGGGYSGSHFSGGGGGYSGSHSSGGGGGYSGSHSSGGGGGHGGGSGRR